MMDAPALNLLLKAALAQPSKKISVLHAQAHPLWLTLGQQAEVQFLQSFKPYILALEALGLQMSDKMSRVELVLFIPSKDKKQSLAWMAEAFMHLVDGGKLMVACENQYGAKSYEAALKKLAGDVSSTSKSKCRLFSAKKTPALNVALQQQWLEGALPHVQQTHGLWAQAGLFSWKSADIGSKLLLEHLPILSGKVMDLCCGYGLLSAHIIKASPDVTALHLVEADRLALDCAEKNMKNFANLHLHHLDATAELLPKHLNAVVCNPPFHTGQNRDVELGQMIVNKACGALTHGGELYLVANRQLPYEHILKAHLREVECLAARDGFKVLRGKK